MGGLEVGEAPEQLMEDGGSRAHARLDGDEGEVGGVSNWRRALRKKVMESSKLEASKYAMPLLLR